MLILKWTFSPADEEISDFSLGELTISGGKGEVTSAGRRPCQSMMIFPSVVMLLDGLRTYLGDRRKTPFSFNGVDASFGFTLTPVPGRQFAVRAAGVDIGQTSEQELVQAVWQSAQAILNAHGDQAGSVADDLAQACADFRTAFRL